MATHQNKRDSASPTSTKSMLPSETWSCACPISSKYNINSIHANYYYLTNQGRTLAHTILPPIELFDLRECNGPTLYASLAWV